MKATCQIDNLYYITGKRPKYERKTAKNDVVLASGWYWILVEGKKRWEIARFQLNMNSFCLVNYGKVKNQSVIGRAKVKEIDPRPLTRKLKNGRPYQVTGEYLWD